jgi:rod shape-determining protein MreC
MAGVINNSTNLASNYLTLDKGYHDGIRKDMAVIYPNGIVGIVNEVSSNFSSVVSLLHPKARISARLKKSDYVGTVIWEGESDTVVTLKDIPTHVKIEVGDTVFTSGYSLLFPEGILIGKVSKFDISHGKGFYHIDVRLSTNFNNIRYVYVVKNLLKDELEELESGAQKE